MTMWRFPRNRGAQLGLSSRTAGGRGMRSMDGIVTIVQEGRFQLTDDAGVSHLCILDRNAAAESD